MENLRLEEISSWVDQKMPEIVMDLERICRLRSVAEVATTNYLPYGKGCRDVLEEMLLIGGEYGFETHNFDYYVGRISYQNQKEAIGIWAHLDTVDEGTGWQYSPYDPIVKDGYFIARGSQDNKSSAIMALYVLKYMKEHSVNLKHSLHLYLGTCEEKGMHDLDYYTSHYACPDLSLVPDSGFPVCCGERGAFNGELTSKECFSNDIIEFFSDSGIYMVPEEAYIVLKRTEELTKKCSQIYQNIHVEIYENTIKIISKGVSTHAANPSGGKHALYHLTKMLCENDMISKEDQRILSLCNEINEDYTGKALNVFCEDDLSGPITLVATQARIEDRHLILGFMSKFPITRNDFAFDKIAEKAAENKGFSLRITRYSKANFFHPKHPVVRTLTETYNEISGEHTEPFVMSGRTYACKLPNAFAFGTGMPLPKPPDGLFMPGHGDYHQPDEAISLERIRKALIIYICGILRVDKLDSLHE